MKVAFVFVLYKTPEKEILRLKKEVTDLHIKDFKIYFIDNSLVNRGYAGAANLGIKKAMAYGAEIIAIANTDISFRKIKGVDIIRASRFFDIFGMAIKQDNRIYYGGEIDPWRLSGGLVEKKPKFRYVRCDFVSGSLIFLNRKVVEKIGLWDESYFLYYEEVDYCRKAYLNGFSVGIDSRIAYTHFETSSQNPEKNWRLFKSRIRFFMKYSSFSQKLRETVRLPKTVLEELVKRPFYLNFFSLNASSIINKILSFVLFLFLISRFRPEEYAIYTIAWTHVGLLMPLLDFGTTSYGLINLEEKKGEDFSNVFSLRIFLSVIAFSLTVIAAFVFKYPSHILKPIILTSFAIFSNTLSGSYLIVASVMKRSYLVSVVSMIFQFLLTTSIITAVIFGKSMISVFYVIFFLYVSYGIANFFLIKTHLPKFVLKINYPSWLLILKKSVVFLAISLLAGFYSKVDILILNFIRGARDVGIFSAGYRFLNAMLFMTVAYNVSSMPLFASFAKNKQKEIFISKVKKDFFLVGILSLSVALFFFLAAPFFLPFFMKGDYRLSIPVLKVIIFALPLIMFSSVFLNAIYSMGKAPLIIALYGGQVVYNVLLNWIFVPKYGYIASAWICLFGETINALSTFLIFKNVFKKYFR